ncbi:stonin-1 [Sphaerodactylus townsendi]|uniref:stonin-1 n=1 Tax=Sphaerodactylus townsendi TaxID=933632 RepID=UPI00202636DA|nr:stonin-1 [Sphaerodactylus townsendi]XP_048375168.1 stonin-1 [Sphaerodactylus townsendi]XP_048375178.1 stonin-1 [Sphaerodactylus townsendi]
MFTTKPANWVTFEDDPVFQSPQKAGGHHGACRTNGLNLMLPKIHDSSQSSSSNNTPLSSPVVDCCVTPGPPSNSPLCTPTKDYPVSPCFPKSGVHLLYSIPELSSNIDLPVAGQSSQKPTSTSWTEHSSLISASKLTDSANAVQQEVSNKLEDSIEPQTFFQYIQNDCAFSSPFWSEDPPAMSSSTCDMHKKDINPENNICCPKEREVLCDQKSLNHGSFHYICKRLEHLQTNNSNCERTLTAMPHMCSGDDSFSFIPHSLFRSQRKDGWPFMLRIPEKKNMMSSRQWGPIYLRVLPGGVLQMYYEKGLEKPFKEFQLQPFCKLSDPKLENCNISGKIHTVKIEHVSYIEKKKYHPKAEVVHEPEVEQMLKLGTTDYDDFTDFLETVEEELMKLPVLSKPRRYYDEQEIILEIVDNFWGRITRAEGKLVESAVITHIYCLSFVNGNLECFLTLNDSELQKRDARYFERDTEKKWIAILDYVFHRCVKQEEFEQSRIIKFMPPEGCRLELMRFKTQYNEPVLPFSVKALVVVQGAYVELQAFINMCSSSIHSHSMKYHCESIMVHFPVPPQWIKSLWTMNLQRQKSLKAKMNRRTCLGSLTEIESDSVIQVSVGTAKYESAYRAVVWKIDRLPDKNSSPDHPHSLSYKLELGSDQEIPSDWYPFAMVQFVVPDACASGTEVKSLGIESDIQPQKHVVQKACYNCQVEIEKKWIRLDGEDPDKAGSCQIQ